MLGGCHAMNALRQGGRAHPARRAGTIESPILLTYTLVGGRRLGGRPAAPARAEPRRARDRDTVNVIVGECFDGWLSDARALAVRPEHALEAIAAASAERDRRGRRGRRARAPPASASRPVSGTSSRAAGGHTLGCLVSRTTARGATCTCSWARPPSRRRRRTGAAGAGRLDHDRARHRRPAVGAPAAPARVTGHVRAGQGGQLRRQRERRVRDRLLHRSPHRAPGGARSRELHLPARRLGRDARSVRGRGRGGAGVGPRTRCARPTRWRAETATAPRRFPKSSSARCRSFGGTD